MTESITIAVPIAAHDVAALQRQAEYDAPNCAAITITCADDYAFADAVLTDIVHRKDAIVAMRKSATTPLYQVVRTIEGWFAPVLVALEQSERTLKTTMGAWRVAELERERAAREAAAVAAESGDATGMILAVTEAAAASDAGAAGRATTRFTWIVKSVDERRLPSIWWIPNCAGLNTLARKAPGDGPAPNVPGVTFERVAIVGARR